MSKGVAYMLATTVLFSFSQVLVKSLQAVPVAEIVFFRALVSLISCGVILQFKQIQFFGHNRRLLFARGAFGTVALFAFFYTLQRMPLAAAVTLQYLSPIFTVLIASLLFKEKPSIMQLVLYLVAFLGVAIMKQPDANVSTLDLAIAVGSAFMSACAYNCIRALRGREHPLVVVFYFPLITVPTMLPLLLSQWHQPSWSEFTALMGVGILTTIYQVLLTLAYQSEKAANVAGINYLGSVFAVLWGVFLFQEYLNWQTALGILLVLFGAFFGSLPRFHKQSPES